MSPKSIFFSKLNFPIVLLTITVSAMGLTSCGSGGSGTTSNNSSVNTVLEIKAPIIVPPVILSGEQTVVTVSVFVSGSDVDLLKLSENEFIKIGDMTDDGSNGDAQAGDRIYTIQTIVNESSSANITFRILATHNNLEEIRDISIPVARIPSLTSNTELNQAAAELYTHAMSLREILVNFDSMPLSIYEDIGNKLLEMFSNYEAITKQDVGKTELFETGRESLSCNELLTAVLENPDDSRLDDFKKSIEEASDGLITVKDLSDPDRNFRRAEIERARKFLFIKKIQLTYGCEGDFDGKLSSILVKEALAPFKSMVTEGIGELFGLGTITTKVTEEVIGILVGWFSDENGNGNIVIGKTANDETFTAPAGTYNLIYSSGGDTPKAEVKNIAVIVQQDTDVSFSPGTITGGYSISGKVSYAGLGLADVKIELDGFETATKTTSADGQYEFHNIANGGYTITPSKTGYTFSPPNFSITVNDTNISGKDFMAVLPDSDVTPPTNTTLNDSVNNGALSTSSCDVTIDISAEDERGVVAYLVKDFNGGEPPSAGDSGWTVITPTTSFSAEVNAVLPLCELSAPPISYEATVFVWFMDAANNISSSAVDNITIILSSNDTTPPEAPAGVSAIPGDGKIIISWNQVPGATSYNMYIASENGITKENYASLQDGMKIETVSSPYTHLNLINDKTYIFVVTAVNDYGESIESIEVSAKPFTSYSISGSVTYNGIGLSGVTVLLSGTDSSFTTTDSNGIYEFIGLDNGPYIITPSKSDYTFDPVNLAIEISNSDIVVEEFVGILDISSTTWAKVYPGQFNSMLQTDEGGYVAVSGKVIKIDANGNFLWQKGYTAEGETISLHGVDQTSDGGYIVAGSTGIYGNYVHLLKLQPNGNVEWSKRYGSYTQNIYHSVRQTSDGGFIITGRIYQSGWNPWVLKVDMNGNIQWEKRYGAEYNLAAFQIEQIMDGGYILAGGCCGSNGLALRLDSDGSIIWQKKFRPQLYSLVVVKSIQQTVDGGFIITGSDRSHLIILKLDADGNMVWQKALTQFSSGYSIRQTTDGGYIVSGAIQLSTSYYDILLLKIDADGNLQWYKTYGDAVSNYTNSLVQQIEGGFILSGVRCSPQGYCLDTWLIKVNDNGGIGEIGNACTMSDASSEIVLSNRNILSESRNASDFDLTSNIDLSTITTSETNIDVITQCTGDVI